MVNRVYVEKRSGFDVEAQQLFAELRDILGIKSLQGLRVLNRYDVEGIDDEAFAAYRSTVFSEPQSDVTYASPEEFLGAVGADEGEDAKQTVFAVEYLPGQFDQRADSASECIQLISQGDRRR